MELMAEKFRELELLVGSVQADVDARLDGLAEGFEPRSADQDVEAISAERICSGAAGRSEDGLTALGELGIEPR
jgi:hypothetical protein